MSSDLGRDGVGITWFMGQPCSRRDVKGRLLIDPEGVTIVSERP